MATKTNNDRIVSRDVNFADWYTSIINNAKLIQYVDTKGFMIFLPYGWSLWESIKNYLDVEFKKLGVKNMYVPLLISISEFEKEKEHVEGFAPELFVINQIGKKTLDEPLAIRPTSEILFCKYFQQAITSYKDLPIKVNQWTSVLRAEKNTRPFLRNSEFHWHETHCSFANEHEADAFAKQYLELYANFCENVLDLPVVRGRKTEGEKFAGADISYTIEAMMQDGQALQSGTSHMLGQGFNKSYDIQYQDKNNKLVFPWNTSHGMSTRIIGAMIMVHSDDKGLVLPIDIAPIQVKIIPLFAEKNPHVYEYAQKIQNILKNSYRTEIDLSNKSMGYALSESEVQGIPFSIVIGPNDLENQSYTLMRRDTSDKLTGKIANLEKELNQWHSEYKHNLFNRAKQQLDSSIVDVESIEDLNQALSEKKWGRAVFGGTIEDEKKIKALTGATPRCIVKTLSNSQKCFFTKKDAKNVVIFARAY